jgi:aminoglycoside phosphotransferase (APT) family kinase protein
MSLESRTYSERLGVIDPDQLQAVADEFGLGRVTAAEPAHAGLFGQILFLTTTVGEYAMRGNPHGHAQLIKERLVARLIHEQSSLAAPWPYNVCEDTDLFGWTYAVMPRLPGTTGSELWKAGDAEQRTALAAACGEALARLHETTSPFFGPYDAQLDAFTELTDFPDWVLRRLDHARTGCRSANALSVEAEQFIDSLIDECAGALAEPFTPVLVHHDFQPGNLTLQRSRSGFAATGVFDLFESYFADGEEDLVRMLRNQTDKQRQAFVDAYTASRPLRPGAAQRLALYALADSLIVWEYGQRNGAWFDDDVTFADTVQPIITAVKAIGS